MGRMERVDSVQIDNEVPTCSFCSFTHAALTPSASRNSSLLTFSNLGGAGRSALQRFLLESVLNFSNLISSVHPEVIRKRQDSTLDHPRHASILPPHLFYCGWGREERVAAVQDPVLEVLGLAPRPAAHTEAQPIVKEGGVLA